MAEFDFDEIIDRRAVPALKHHRVVLGTDGLDLFPGGVADMDFRVAPCISEAMERRIAHGVFGYETVPDGLFPALTVWVRNRHDWVVDPETIMRAPNVLNALSMAVNAFTDPGAGIVIQPPVFFDFADIITENGRRIVENPLILRNGRYEMDLEHFEHVARDPKTRMFFLCNPHNPVGRVWTREDLSRVAEICLRNEVIIVADELHGDITYPGHPYTPLASLGSDAARNSITCLSPAKSFNIAGCCSAFTIVPDENLRKVLQAENSRLTVNKNNAFASVAMEAAYAHGAPWLDAVVAYLGKNLNLIESYLAEVDGVALIKPEGTFLAWLDFRALGLSADALTVFLREKAGWAITRGISFGLTGAGFARLNFACPRSRLDAALHDLSHAVRIR